MAKRPKGQGKGALTPAELAALDFVIKDMEEQGETNLQLGFFWATIARAALLHALERVGGHALSRDPACKRVFLTLPRGPPPHPNESAKRGPGRVRRS